MPVWNLCQEPISSTENPKHTCSCRHMLQSSVQLCSSVETPPLASSLGPHSLQNCLTYFQVTAHHSSIISFIPHSSLCSFARPPHFQCSASLCPTCQLGFRLSGLQVGWSSNLEFITTLSYYLLHNSYFQEAA